MKLIRAEKDQFTFGLNQRERELLFQILKMFPLIPPSHHQLSKTGKARPEDQRLLDEAVAEQRGENAKRVQAFLDEPGKFREIQNEIQFSLALAEIEWLLQVLNDVRVGAWLALGEPEEFALPKIEKNNARYFFAMEVSGHFQVELLAALGHDQSNYFGKS